nr:methyl-accepting chemotaxis protein [Rhizomicrobium electricum]
MVIADAEWSCISDGGRSGRRSNRVFVGIKDLSVSKKVIGAFALVLIATIGLGFFSVGRLSLVNQKAADIRDNWLPATRELGEIKYITMRYRQRQAVYLMLTSDTEREKERSNMAALRTEFDEAYKKYEATIDTDEEREIAKAINAAWQSYLARETSLFGDQQSKGSAAAFEDYKTTSKDLFDVVRNAIATDIKFNAEHGATAAADAQKTFKQAQVLIYGALAIALALGLGCGFALIRSVSKPLSNMTDAMGELANGNLDAHVPHADQHDEIGQLAGAMTAFKNQLAAAERSKAEQTKVIVSSIGKGLDQLAQGDLTHRISTDLTGPFAKLKEDFNNAMEHLEHTMQNVLSSTSQIATGAGEVSQAADDLAHRTEKQAASLEETAAALEEITATVKKTAQNARDASATVAEAKKAAEEGGRVVDTAVKAMDAIADSSKQITDIISVIDEIAFQTNLLALNAGVEAARAGEAGRGFAVVASEVRALAQRSSEAAKQIKMLIGTSGEHVGTGVKLVGESGRALRHIIDQVLHINALVTEMTNASEQQSAGLEQVNSAVGQMDQVTQQNAAMVEESTAASRSLAGETHKLNEIVSFFEVRQADHSNKSVHPVERFVTKANARNPLPQRTSSPRPAPRATAMAAVQTADEDWAEF